MTSISEIVAVATDASFDAESYLTTIAIWATEGVLGLTALGVLYLWRSHYEFREHVANTYVKNDDLVHKIDKVEFDSGWVNVGNGTPVRLTGVVHSAGTAPPSGGTWSVGDLFVNTQPSVLGTAGSQYIVDHWRCVTAGTPGTWVACRTLTGT